MKTFPPANGILLILFIVSVFKIIAAFFLHSKKSPLGTAKDFQKTHVSSPDDAETDREQEEEEKETKLLKRKTMKLTKLEINTIDDIEGYLQQMIHSIKEKGIAIEQEEIAELTHTLRQIAQKENILKKGMMLITRHIHSYQALHRRDIPELEKRLAETTDKKARQTIEEEIYYQKRMLDALDFMQKYESKIQYIYPVI